MSRVQVRSPSRIWTDGQPAHPAGCALGHQKQDGRLQRLPRQVDANHFHGGRGS